MIGYTQEEALKMHYALIVSNEALRATEIFMIGQKMDVEDINKTVMENDAILDELGELRTED